MDFLGVGSLELLVIMVVALLILGPNRVVDMARGAGKIVRELRRTVGEATRMIEEVPPEDDSGSNGTSKPTDKEQ